MKESPIFTRRRMGLDRGVWAMMICVCIICLGLLSYKMVSVEPCAKITISIQNNMGSFGDFYQDDMLRLSAFMQNSKDITWDFGDNTRVEEGVAVSHAFKNYGNFPVTVRVNGRCYETAMVKVLKKREVIDTAVFASDNILTGNKDPYVGERVSFTSKVDAKSYEWSIENSSFPVYNDKIATYVFNAPGLYTVILKLDNNPKKVSIMPVMVAPAKITVGPKPSNVPQLLPVIPPYTPPVEKHDEPKPEPALTEKPKPEPAQPVQEEPKRVYSYKSTAQIKLMLDEVISGDKNVTDFDKYLCDGSKTKVNENGKESTFGQLCENLAGEKNIKDLSVEFVDFTNFPDKTKCVKVLKVKYTKKKKPWFNKS